MVDRERIRSDFNGLADHAAPLWDRNIHYHPWLLGRLPLRPRRVLEIGCGQGRLTHALAHRAQHVVAVDLSERMLEAAARECRTDHNISFIQADFLEMKWPDDHFDCVVSIATLHHLPLAETLQRVVRLLAPSGTFILVDLYRIEGLFETISAGFGAGVGALLQRWNTGAWTTDPSLRSKWVEHSHHDDLMSFCNIEATFRSFMPSAKVRRRLLLRYSAVWRKQPPQRT